MYAFGSAHEKNVVWITCRSNVQQGDRPCRTRRFCCTKLKLLYQTDSDATPLLYLSRDHHFQMLEASVIRSLGFLRQVGQASRECRAICGGWGVWGVFRRSHGIPARGTSGTQAPGSEVGLVVGARMVAMVTSIDPFTF